MTMELLRQYLEFIMWAMDLLGWAMLALISLTGILICFVVVLFISNERRRANMEQELVRLETAANSIAANAATALVVVVELRAAKTDLETLVAELRKQLSEGGQIDPARLNVVSETLERAGGLIRSIATPVPVEQPSTPQSEGASVIDIARANERAGQGSAGTGVMSTGGGGEQAPGTVTSEADGG